MDHAIGNAIRLGSISLREALAMATVNPARVARIAGRQKGFSPGERADFVRFRWDDRARSLTVIETIVAGSTVYQA
jgi:N-acetylglucosamine-6-phosphate deacetylase